MGQVSVTINGRKYQIACDDGQEAHLARLSAYVDKRISELVASVGQIGDSILLVMASLLVADELSDVYAELDNLRSSDMGATARLEAEEALSANMEKIAEHLENIADRLEQS